MRSKKKKIKVGDIVVPVSRTSNGYTINTIETAEVVRFDQWRSMVIKITKGYAGDGWGMTSQTTISVTKQSFKILEKVSSSLYPIY